MHSVHGTRCILASTLNEFVLTSTKMLVLIDPAVPVSVHAWATLLLGATSPVTFTVVGVPAGTDV